MSSAYDTLILSEANLLAYWPFNDTGSTATDATGNGHNAALVSGVTTGAASLLPADSETAMNWTNTVSNEMAISAPSSFAVSTPAVEFWIDPAAIPSGTINQHIFRAGEFPNGGFGVGFHGPNWLFTTYTHADNVFSSGPTVGTKYYVVMQRDSSGNCQLWVNNSLVQTLTGVGITAFSDVAGMGGQAGESSWLNGVWQKLAVYSAPLTSTQIGNHYTTGTAVSKTVSAGASIALKAAGLTQAAGASIALKAAGLATAAGAAIALKATGVSVSAAASIALVGTGVIPPVFFGATIAAASDAPAPVITASRPNTDDSPIGGTSQT